MNLGNQISTVSSVIEESKRFYGLKVDRVESSALLFEATRFYLFHDNSPDSNRLYFGAIMDADLIESPEIPSSFRSFLDNELDYCIDELQTLKDLNAKNKVAERYLNKIIGPYIKAISGIIIDLT